jgi:hypothetical protein
MQTKNLELVFQTSGGGKLRLTVPEPRADLTPAQIQAAMNTIIDKNIITCSTGHLTAILTAQIVSRDTTALLTP